MGNQGGVMPQHGWPVAATTDDDSIPKVLPAAMEKRLAETAGQSPPRPVPPPPVPGKEFEGSLKSLSDRKGYGFIACEEVHRIYGRDAYLPAESMPDGAKVLDRLRFTIGLSPKGHPQAENPKIVKI